MPAAVTDFAQFASLRASADRQDPAALREVAGQFEALFIQTLLKNMRGAQLAEPMFGSEQMDMYHDMFDQQLAVEMASGRGIGLSDMLVRQLSGEAASMPQRSHALGAARPASGQTALLPQVSHAPGATHGTTGQAANIPTWSSPQEFVSDIWPHARRAAERLQVAPEGLVAQAALESGWGRHVMDDSTGGSSFNLFGIKAGNGWQGETVSKATLEFENGIAERRVEKFRSYPDLAAVFDDYAEFIGGRSRYAQAIGKGDDISGFAAALQEAGYATDPSYAKKIERVLHGDTLREALQPLKNTNAPPIDSRTASGSMN